MAHVVFVGLGFGGLYTLRHLLNDLPEGTRITAVDPRDRFVFTPLLYEFLADELEPDVVAPAFDTLLPDGPVDRIRAAARTIDVRGRSIGLEDGRRISFDTLVLAPGSVPAFHGVPGSVEHAFPFYSFEDADRLRTALQMREWARGGQPACVVGGGVVGIELAFTLAEILAAQDQPPRGTRVVVLEAMDDILRGLSDGLRRMAWRKLHEAGIEVRTSVRVLEVDDRGVAFRNGGMQRFDAAVVAWAAGIQPNPLLAQLPAEAGGRHGVRCEQTLQLPGFPNVFILGDAISYPGRAVGAPLPDTAQAAVQQVDVAAANIAEWLRGGLPRERYRYGHLGDFLRLGRGEAIADIKGVVLDGGAAALARRAAYLFRLPAWAIRTSAIRQWLG
ncbi:MAG TPA: FAD-dependent oxidoreductase [Longimicrobiales bacterium]